MLQHQRVPGRAAGRRDQHRLAGQRVRSITSKNDLNSPLYEAEKTGVTAIRPSASVTASIASASAGAGNPVTRWLAMSHGQVAQLDDPHLDRGVLLGEPPRRLASRSASSRVDDGTLSPAETTTSFMRALMVLRPPSCACGHGRVRRGVGASGTPAGRRLANSLRSTGTTSSPSMSSCSRTVFSGSPAWSIRNSWRW